MRVSIILVNYERDSDFLIVRDSNSNEIYKALVTMVHLRTYNYFKNFPKILHFGITEKICVSGLFREKRAFIQGVHQLVAKCHENGLVKMYMGSTL